MMRVGKTPFQNPSNPASLYKSLTCRDMHVNRSRKTTHSTIIRTLYPTIGMKTSWQDEAWTWQHHILQTKTRNVSHSNRFFWKDLPYIFEFLYIATRHVNDEVPNSHGVSVSELKMHTVSRAPSCDLVGDPLKLGFVTAELGSPPSTCTVRSFSVEDVGPFFRFWVWNKQSEIIFITVTKISSSGHQMTQPFHKIRWASEKNS